MGCLLCVGAYYPDFTVYDFTSSTATQSNLLKTKMQLGNSQRTGFLTLSGVARISELLGMAICAGHVSSVWFASTPGRAEE